MIRKFELQGCPWCNELPSMGEDTFGGRYYVRCYNNECHVKPFVLGDTADDAVVKWNCTQDRKDVRIYHVEVNMPDEKLELDSIPRGLW